jgi:hypothetical protein
VEQATIPAGEPIRITGVTRLPDEPIVVRVLQYRTEVLHAISSVPGCDGFFRTSLDLPETLRGPITLEAYIPSDEGTKRYQALRDLIVE